MLLFAQVTDMVATSRPAMTCHSSKLSLTAGTATSLPDASFTTKTSVLATGAAEIVLYLPLSLSQMFLEVH